MYNYHFVILHRCCDCNNICLSSSAYTCSLVFYSCCVRIPHRHDLDESLQGERVVDVQYRKLTRQVFYLTWHASMQGYQALELSACDHIAKLLQPKIKIKGVPKINKVPRVCIY